MGGICLQEMVPMVHLKAIQAAFLTFKVSEPRYDNGQKRRSTEFVITWNDGTQPGTHATEG